MTSVSLGYTFALVTAGCWAHNNVAYTLAGKRVGSQTVTHIRLWFALPAMFLVHLLLRGTLWPEGIDTRTFIFLASSGVLGFCITDMLIFKALVELGARETAVIMGLTPIVGSILSWILFGQTLTGLQIIGVLVTISGVTWVVIEEGNSRKQRSRLWVGLVAAIAGAILQAVTMILAKAGMSAGAHPVSGNLVRLVFGLIGMTFVVSFQRSWRKDFRSMADRKAMLHIGSGALIGPVLGMILALYAIANAPVGLVLGLMQLTPILLLPADVFIFKKPLTFGAIAGTCLAVAGTTIIFLA